MEKRLGVAQVNFDYESLLFNEQIDPSWAHSINTQLEYIALLWGGVESLKNCVQYSDHYLKHLENLGFVLPTLTQKPRDYWFWGPLLNLSAERLWNSKETSFQLAQQNSWTHPEEQLLNDWGEVKQSLRRGQKYVLKPIDSVSSRGFIFFDGEGENPKIENAKKYILSPWLQRICDLSYIKRGDFEYFFLNTNDGKGTFRGTIIMPESKLEQYFEMEFGLSFEKIKEKHQRIQKYYQGLGINEIQVDSFVYKNDEGRYVHYALSEVNCRKTMGELALRLHQRFFSKDESSQIVFSPRKEKHSEIQLSPENSRYQLIIKKYN